MNSLHPIHIDENLLFSQSLINFCKDKCSAYTIITDDNVQPLYATRLQEHFKKHDISTHVITVANGEQSKTREIASKIQDQLFELSCGRDTGIIALGGGMITDLAGFVAATYCRGIPAIYLPTSLLAMVDAAIGGKTGVNTDYGKNLIGVFSQPKAVFSDINTLLTLPEAEYITAFAEIIKHALIFDADYFDFLMTHADQLKQRDLTCLKLVIQKSCDIKSTIVSKDEKDQGFRAICNFGHTIGHAIELVSNYSINHGQAVALGILVESSISEQLGILSSNDVEKINNIMMRFSLPLSNFPFDKQLLKNALILDKKSREKIPHFVILKKIGETYNDNGSYTMPISEEILDKALMTLAK